jgi:hypothetical protein
MREALQSELIDFRLGFLSSRFMTSHRSDSGKSVYLGDPPEENFNLHQASRVTVK